MTTVVAFDLDGTLVDSRLDLAESANTMLSTFGVAPLPVDTVASMVGDGARQLVARVLSAGGVEGDVSAALDQFLAIYGSRLVANTRPYPGTVEAVERLARQHALAVLTNKPEGLSRRILDAFGLTRFFSDVIGGDSGFPRKPDPAGLRHLVAQAGSVPDRTVYIGDSMIDVETARAAGTGLIVARYGFGHLRQPIFVGPDELEARSAFELPALVERIVAAP